MMHSDFSQALIHTKYGFVRGFSNGDLKIFNGIPYAAAPVGELRFQRAQPPQAWDGELLCRDYKPIAPQREFAIGKFEPYETDFYYEPVPEMSEDCLYLNITTGACSEQECRPVCMWFHGGGLTTGWSYEPEFNPEVLAKKGIVVVTVAQRLGVFGYLTLPQLCDSQGRCGNYGFSDQLAALEWVYENIAFFGGDPERITAAGQSGGSLKASALATSPAAHGRVRRVIAQSGLKWRRNYPTLDKAFENSRRYLTQMGIDPNTSREQLLSLPVQAFVRPGAGAMAGVQMPGQMICDGDLLLPCDGEHSLEVYPEGMELLIGMNLGEADAPALTSADDFYTYYKTLLGTCFDETDFKALIPVTDATAQQTARILASYGLCADENLFFSRNLMTDRIFGMHRAGYGRVYTYLFSHRTPHRKQDTGTARDPQTLMAWHASELWYTFASLRRGIPPARPWHTFDFALADQMSSYWANFIRTGNPNGTALPEWPETDMGGYMDFTDHGPEAHPGIADGLDRLIFEFNRNKA